MPTKVLLVNAINPYAEIEYRYPSLGLGYLASSLRAHFGADTFQFRVVNRDVEQVLVDFQPDIVGITTVTQNYSIAKKYARAIRQKKIPVIIGGIHISLLPSSLSPDMDVGVIGEGEEAILELFELFMKKGNFDSEGVSQIKGIVYRSPGGEIRLTEKRPPLFPLDRISLPARDLLSIEKHSYLFSSRGCPFRCVFCASSRYWGPVRFFSAEYVVREIRELVDAYGVKLISFYDDLMIADGARLKKIVSLLQREDFLAKVKFSLNARANLLDEGVVKLLKEMNVVSVGMGLESGNERVLRYLKGSHISVDDNRAAIRLLRKYGIAANASFVIGSPDETEKEIWDTYRFIKTSGLSFVDTYVITPFPGTPIWEYAKSIGAVQDDMEWGRLNVNYGTNPHPVILSQTLNKEALDRLFAKFQRLRLLIAMKNILRHPFFWDICRLSARRILNRIRKVHKRRGHISFLGG